MNDPTPVTTASTWPANELEHLGRCPVCGCAGRDLLHAGLADDLFHSSNDRWQMFRCHGCGCASLDPRPDAASIVKAYRDYLTHGAPAYEPAAGPTTQAAPSTRLPDRLRLWLKSGLNGYRNARWGTHLVPARHSALWWSTLVWPLRSLLTLQMRHMPARLPGAPATLLDVGCGNGAFLELAQSAGWRVQGLDFDPAAVASARQRGLNVQQGQLDQLQPASQTFDWITCSHVIEHVHDPVALLRGMAARLNPGGTLWLQTPNIDSLGHAHFGPNWRGLEPPRHLVLFTPEALCRACHDVGLVPRLHRLPALSAATIHQASADLRAGRAPDAHVDWGRLLRSSHPWLGLWQAVFTRRAECITVTAVRRAE